MQEIEVPDTAESTNADAFTQTTTFVMEPNSFVPLVRIESSEPEEIYAPGTVYLPGVESWELPGTRWDACGHVRAYEAHEGECRPAALRSQRTQEAARNADGDRIHYYQVDHLDTPLELLDAEGNTAWAAKYRAWGRVWQLEVDQVKQPLRFQGQYFDEESGLHYNWYRYYDPELGRFVGQDPVGLLGGANVYHYANNPVVWIDPMGLAKKAKSVFINGCEVLGEGQDTGGKDHATISEKLAEKLALTGKYAKIGIDLAIKTVTGVATDPITRPDVTGLRKDGKVDIFEVPSPIDKLGKLQNKANALMTQLGNRAGNYAATKRCERK